jgi:general secretion pathway protein I
MKAERGFTLLEVMVALAVFATLAAAVLSASQWVLRQSQQVEERVLAAWVLDNRMQALRLEPELLQRAADRASSLGGRQWQIEQQVVRVPGQALWRVELRATLEGVERHRLHAWLAGVP